MGIKAIDSEGLKSRTRRYEQSNVYEMFSDIRKIKRVLKQTRRWLKVALENFQVLDMRI